MLTESLPGMCFGSSTFVDLLSSKFYFWCRIRKSHAVNMIYTLVKLSYYLSANHVQLLLARIYQQTDFPFFNLLQRHGTLIHPPPQHTLSLSFSQKLEM